MDKQIKKQWIDELRNGGYKQARGTLKKRNGAMCCLGVLEFEVLGLPCEYNPKQKNYNTQDGINTDLSMIAQEKTGLKSREIYKLADMNDGRGAFNPHSFDEIADYIEKHL